MFLLQDFALAVPSVWYALPADVHKLFPHFIQVFMQMSPPQIGLCSPSQYSFNFLSLTLLVFLYFIFTERGMEGEKEGEEH